MCILLHCLEHWTSNEEGAGLKPAVAKQNVATWSAIVIFSVAVYINYHRATAVIISAVLKSFTLHGIYSMSVGSVSILAE